MLQKTNENSKQGCLAFLFGNTTTDPTNEQAVGNTPSQAW